MRFAGALGGVILLSFSFTFPNRAASDAGQYLHLSDLQGSSATFSTVLVNEFSAENDGGGGTFIRHGSDCAGTFAVGDDGGTVIQAKNGQTKYSCYYRQFAGTVHLKWYGVNSTTPDVAVACTISPNTNCLANAFAAAQHLGNNTVDMDGLRVASSADVEPLANQRLTCSASFTGLMSHSNYLAVGGAVVLGHGASIHLINDQIEFDHCIVVTTGNGTNINLDPNDSATPQRTIINNYAAMVTNSDTGILCDTAEQTYVHDVTVIGFDTGIGAFNCSRFRLNGANVDANVGAFIANAGAPTYISNYHLAPFLATQVDGKNTNYNITNITSDGALCKVAIPTGNNVTDGDTVFVLPTQATNYSAMGVISCHGRFVVSKKDPTHFDLLNSHYGTNASPYNFLTTTGSSWVQNSHVLDFTVSTPSDALGVRAGETVKSSDATVFPAGQAAVLSVSKYLKNGQYRIVVDATTQHSSSGSPTLTFYNLGPYDQTQHDSNLYLYPTARVSAGTSIGGIATNGAAACLQGGGPGDNSALAIVADSVFCFGHLYQYHFDSVDPLYCTGCGTDSDPELSDEQQIGLYYGHGLTKIPVLQGITTLNSFTITSVTLNGIPLDARFAGWKQMVMSGYAGDTITGTNIPSGTRINSISFTRGATSSGTITMSQNASGSSMTSENITDTAVDTLVPTGKANFIGSITGGGNVIVDAAGGPCKAISGTAVAANMNGRLAAELLDGCVNLTGVSSKEQNDVLVGSSLTTGSSMVGSYINGSIYDENPIARTLDAAGISIASGLGNGLRQCNPNYMPGCLQYSLYDNGSWRLLDSSKNPVQEFNDASHLHLSNTYQDAIMATSSNPLLTAGINVVASCGAGCGVQLPASTKLLDVSPTPSGSACASLTGSNCGAAGAVIVVNNTASTLNVVPVSQDTVDGVANVTINQHRAKSFWPVSGAGYISN